MDSTQHNTGLKIWMPAVYRIRVQGFLDKSYADRLGGLTIAPADPHDEAPVTTLCGRLLDQAALLGVLNTLYNHLHMPLLLVECVEIGEDVKYE